MESYLFQEVKELVGLIWPNNLTTICVSDEFKEFVYRIDA